LAALVTVVTAVGMVLTAPVGRLVAPMAALPVVDRRLV